MTPKADIHILDCRDMLPKLASESVHCVVTSPPYWGLRDYGVDKQIGLEGLDEFIDTLVQIFREVHRVLRKEGTVWLNLGDTYCNKPGNWRGGQNYLEGSTPHCSAMDKTHAGKGIKKKDLIGIPWRVAFALQDDGWYLRSDIIWHKPNPVPEPLDRGRPTVAHEYLFLLAKSPRYYYDAIAICEPKGDEPSWEEYQASLGSNTGCDSERWTKGYKKISHEMSHPAGRNKRTVWTIPTKGFKGAHYATFPPKLVEPCILAGTSERGACSSCGSPWARVTQETPEYKERLGKSWHNHEEDIKRGQRGVPAAFRDGPTHVTIGWEPSCDCGAGVVPCTVMDPFAGTGTVGEIALQHGRHAVLIELNPDNQKFIEERVAQQRLGLFTAGAPA